MKKKWLARSLVYLSIIGFFSWIEASFFLFARFPGLIIGNIVLIIMFSLYKISFWCGYHWNDDKKL